MANSRYKPATHGGSGSGSGSGSGQSLLIDVRAGTQGFAQDMAALRGAFDGTLLGGFTQAGNVLETALVGAVKNSSASFSGLRTTALGVIAEIAGAAASILIGGSGGTSSGGGGGGLGGLLGSVLSLGLPGRATGGPVSPGTPYVVGENGPELFVPTSAGAVATGGGGAREVRLTINVNAPAGGDAPQALQRSSRQVASAVRRALSAA